VGRFEGRAQTRETFATHRRVAGFQLHNKLQDVTSRSDIVHIALPIHLQILYCQEGSSPPHKAGLIGKVD
jgi:hypothetical protein